MKISAEQAEVALAVASLGSEDPEIRKARFTYRGYYAYRGQLERESTFYSHLTDRVHIFSSSLGLFAFVTDQPEDLARVFLISYRPEHWRLVSPLELLAEARQSS